MSQFYQNPDNFLATDGVERCSSVDSVVSDIVAVDFVNAVAHLGPDHLVEAMYEAVSHLKVGGERERASTFMAAAPRLISQHQQQQTIYVTNDSPAVGDNNNSRSTSFTETSTTVTAKPSTSTIDNNNNNNNNRIKKALPPGPSKQRHSKPQLRSISDHDGDDDVDHGDDSETRKSTTHSIVEGIDDDDELLHHQRKMRQQTETPKFEPIFTHLKHSPSRRRAAKKGEDLRDSAFIEGSDPAFVCIPPKAPRGNNYPSTPSYWGTSSSSASGGSVKSPLSRQQKDPATISILQKRVGIMTPPVPRPDLYEDTEAADQALLEDRKRRAGGGRLLSALTGDVITLAEIEAEEEAKRQKTANDKNWQHDLKRRVAALSEHYRRQFSSKENEILSAHAAADDLQRQNTRSDSTSRSNRIPVKQPATPSETVFKSRAVRMSAAEHNIISASPQLQAALEGKPRIRSPYGSLLSVSELDHFVPSVPQLATAAKLSSPHREHFVNNPTNKSNETIERVLREGSVDIANRAMSSVDRWTANSSKNKNSSSVAAYPYFNSSNKTGEEDYYFVSSSFDRPIIMPAPGSRAVEVDLERNRTSEEDMISSPQLSAMLTRIMQQREEMEKSGGKMQLQNAVVRNAENEDGSEETLFVGRRSMLYRD